MPETTPTPLNLAFLTETDFDVQVKEEILTLLGTNGTIEKAERMAIDQVKAHISGRYDTAVIFDKKDDDRDFYLVMIIIDMILYHLWAKKAPRQIPEYRDKRYTDALSWLTDIGTGKIRTDLPQLPSDTYENEIRIYSTHTVNNNKY